MAIALVELKLQIRQACGLELVAGCDNTLAHIADGIILARHEEDGQVLFHIGDVFGFVIVEGGLQKSAVGSQGEDKGALGVLVVVGDILDILGEPAAAWVVAVAVKLLVGRAVGQRLHQLAAEGLALED